jgi:signal transduction histidine kinase
LATIDSTLQLAPYTGLAPVVAKGHSDPIQACKILIIDDEQTNVRLLERVLMRAGFRNLSSTTDSREAAALFAESEPDIVLTDWLMPVVDGCAVIERLRALTASDEYLPIVVLTADITAETKERALTAGATDFLTKPFDYVEVVLRIRNLLQARLSYLLVQAQNATLEESVRHRTVELEGALRELRDTQKQVIQQERLAALGTMAGGIAHDFNNALSIIMGFSEVLLRDAGNGPTGEAVAKSATFILTAAEDAASVVHRLSEFYRPVQIEEQRVPIDLNKLIEQAVLLTQPRWQTEATAHGCAISVTTAPGDIPLVTGEPAELREALTNLIFNAVDALPKGGVITIATRLDDDAVVLTIHDTGIGMSEEVSRHCLEPFFTTKGDRGTGLGLSMVFGIVQRHGGSINILSKLGEGSTFVLRLPVANPETLTNLDVLPRVQSPLRILVVDDQPIFCELLCDSLQHDLHTVEVALSAKEALEKFNAGHFDLVITDRVMTGITGDRLAAMIKKTNPKMPIILLTSYTDAADADQGYSDAVDIVLKKPVSRAALRQAFARAMIAR